MRKHSDSTNLCRMRGRRRLRALYFTALLGFIIGGCVWLTVYVRADAVTPVQLVRLVVTSDTGLVRIEITADGSLGETLIEQHTRGREAVVRIRGARSLLRANYAVEETVARGVRTISGEINGEPFVDIVIAMGEGASLAQKKNFNRLVIGIANDFARLRRKSPAQGENQQARRAEPNQQTGTRSVTIASAPVTDAIGARPTDSNATINTPVVNQTSPSTAQASISNAPTVVVNAPLETSSLAPVAPVFRGRTIWNSLQPRQATLARSNLKGIAPTFFNSTLETPLAVESEALSFFPMSLDAPGTLPGVWLPGTTTSVSDQVGGRAVGPGFLRPLFSFGATFDDNFFYRSQVGRNIGIFSFVPRLEYEIPGDTAALRLAYEARLRRLTNGKWANGHVFDFDTRFNLGSSLRLALRDHFIRSALDPREYDAAGETYIVGDTFTRNDGAMRLEYLATPRGRIAFDLGYNLVRWSERHIASAPLFLNYDDLSAAASYERDLSENTTGIISFSFANANTSVPLRPQFDGLNDRQRFALELGARHQVTESSGMAFRVGFERSLYRHAPSVNNFSGLVFDLRFSGDLREKTKFELAALRKTQLSAFNLEGGNARLITTGGAARLEQGFRDSLKLGLSLNYQRLGFPVAILGNSTASGGVFVGNFAGERRDEHLYGFGFDAGLEFSDLLRMRLQYNFLRRDSTIPVFTFNTNRVSLIFEFGRRNDVIGRPF